MTAISATAGWVANAASRSVAKTLKPPEMMTSFLRSSRYKKPSESKRPMSPERKYSLPSSVAKVELGGLFGAVQIAAHHVRRAPDDFAGLTRRDVYARLPSTMRISHPGDGRPTLASLLFVPSRFEDRDRGCLR